MKLYGALAKSEHKAAILSHPNRLWNIVVVRWGPGEFSTEIHQYNTGGELEFQIVSYKRVHDDAVRRQLGEECYFSSEWQPYAAPTPGDLRNHKLKLVRKRFRPPQRKDVTLPLSQSEWDALVRQAYE